jgi:glycerol-3-phosphate acyltransferase PlsY
MNASQWLVLLIPLAYLLGSVPFGLIVGKMNGIDVRSAGSKNIGATNVGRLLGRKFFFLVFFLDLLKSLLPMIVASMLVLRVDAPLRDRTLHLLWLLVGFAAVLGHMFSCFLGFKGGKGVATSAGMMLGLYPYFTIPGAAAIVVFILVFLATRYVSLGSMTSACAFPVLYFAFGRWRGWDVTGNQLPLLVFSVLIAVLIVIKHRTNIARLLAGTENRIGR